MKKTKKQNQTIKKLLILTLCLTIALGLTACKNSKINTDELESGLEELSGILETEETEEEGEGEEGEEESEESEETKAPKVNDKPEETTKPEETKTPEKDIKPKVTEVPKATEAPNKTTTPKAPTPSYKKVSDTRYAKSSVNVRSGPGTSYKKIGSLKAGQKVTRIGVCDNGWGVIDFSGKEGYVSGNYLVDTKPVVQTAEKPKDSKPAETKAKPAEPKGQDTNTDDKPSDERVPRKSADYKPVPEGWIYSEGLFGPAATPEQKKQISSWVESWRKGGFTDKQLEDKLYSYMWETKAPDEEIDFIHVYVSGSNTTPFISKDTPGKVENSANIDEVIYSYSGLYCTGELDTESDGDFTLFNRWTIGIDKFLKE